MPLMKLKGIREAFHELDPGSGKVKSRFCVLVNNSPGWFMGGNKYKGVENGRNTDSQRLRSLIMLIQCSFHLYFPQSHHNTSKLLLIHVKCDINQRRVGALKAPLERKSLSQSANVIKMHQGTEKKSFSNFKLVIPSITKKEAIK